MRFNRPPYLVILFIMFLFNTVLSLAVDLPSQADLYLDKTASLMDQADKRLAYLNEEVAEFFDYLDQSRERFEPLLKEEGEWEVRLNQDNEFKNRIVKTNKAFLEFRHHAANSIAMTYNGSPYSCLVYAHSVSGLTEWYVSYLEEMLFPKGWQSIYEGYLLEDKGRPISKAA